MILEGEYYIYYTRPAAELASFKIHSEATPSEWLFDLFAILGLVIIARSPWTHSEHAWNMLETCSKRMEYDGMILLAAFFRH